MQDHDNPMGTDGFECLEFFSPEPEKLARDFQALGFVRVAKHRSKAIDLYQQGDIHFLLTQEPNSHAAQFSKTHGACVAAMGFRVKDAKQAYQRALTLGARPYQQAEGLQSLDYLAIYGIGDSLLYFIDTEPEHSAYANAFEPCVDAALATGGRGLVLLDHVTHNVFTGRMDHWARYYETLFNFREIRYFDIRGKKTGLLSRALTSPCNKIRIPLNEATEDASQIAEFLRAYNGEGIQHIALAAADIYSSVAAMQQHQVKFLHTPDSYYRQIDARVPGHCEEVARLQEYRILIDGNPQQNQGVLLQIFTENMLGPVFFEIIQRKGNEGFGEGNFQALFEAIELDQIERGVL